MTQCTASDLQSAFPDLYRSLDLRIAAIKVEDKWLSAVTVIRWRHEEVSEVNSIHDDLRRTHPPVQAVSLRIILKALPFSEWESLESQLLAGQLQTELGNVEVPVFQDVRTRLGYAARNLGILSKTEPDWPHCGISWERQWNPQLFSMANALLSDRRLSAELTRSGYSNAYEVIDTFCQFQSSSERNNIGIYISIPVPALIESVTLEPVTRVVKVHFRYREDIGPVSCFAVLKHSPMNTGLIPKRVGSGNAEIASKDEGVVYAVATVELPQVQEEDFIEVRLMAASGEADSYQRGVQELVPAAQINPLYQTLLVFRDAESVMSDLTRPQSRALPKKPQPWQQSDYYERSVAWILSCFGFQCIMLGEHEKLKDPVSRVELGTIDLLAFDKSSGVFLLVACSMGTPKEEDFNRLIQLRDVIWQRVFNDTDLTLVPIVFTATKFSDYWSPAVSESVFSIPDRIPVIDLERSRQITSLLEKRQEKRFIAFVKNPNIGF